jgi:hypothetical protein
MRSFSVRVNGMHIVSWVWLDKPSRRLKSDFIPVEVSTCTARVCLRSNSYDLAGFPVSEPDGGGVGTRNISTSTCPDRFLNRVGMVDRVNARTSIELVSIVDSLRSCDHVRALNSVS